MKSTETIWKEYHTKLSVFLRSRVAEEAVEDLLQDVFTKIHARINSLRDDQKLESWLYQITRNTVIDYYRTKRSTEELPDWIEQEQPEEDSVRKALSMCLEPMLLELPEKYRTAVRMSELENRTQKEVAELEGLSFSGAKSRVQRGRALLKNMLHDCCQIEVNNRNQPVSFEKKGSDCKFCE